MQVVSGDYHGNHHVKCSHGHEHNKKDGPKNVVVAGLTDGGREEGREREEGGSEGGREIRREVYRKRERYQ